LPAFFSPLMPVFEALLSRQSGPGAVAQNQAENQSENGDQFFSDPPDIDLLHVRPPSSEGEQRD
jgi:hypothetical protein